VSSLPQVDFPTIQVTTQLPGASPDRPRGFGEERNPEVLVVVVQSAASDWAAARLPAARPTEGRSGA
jgi:hypothetical protein